MSGWEIGCRTSALEELCILLTDLGHQMGGRKGAEQGLSFRDTVSQAALLNGLHSLHRSVRGEAPQPNEFQLERVKRKI